MSKTSRHCRNKSLSDSELDSPRVKQILREKQILYNMLSESKLNVPQLNGHSGSKILKLNAIKLKFPDVSDSEEIINDFSCALKKDLLLHGRLYIGIENFYFLSNILSYETKVAEKWTNVISVEKAKLANIIPNSIKIVTTDAKYTFTSFVARGYPFALIDYAIRNKKEQLALQSFQIREIVKSKSVKSKKLNRSNSKLSNSNYILNHKPIKILNDELKSEHLHSLSTALPKLSLKIVPEDKKDQFILQTNSQNCSCHKLKHLVLNKVFKVNIDDIFNVLYDDKSFIMKNIYERSNFQDYKLQSNHTIEDGSIVKVSSTSLPNAFLGKTAKSIITQTFPKTNIPNEHYRVNTISKTEGVPFSDSFEVVAQTCLLKYDQNITFYKSWVEIKFVKDGWTIPKDKIEKSSVKTYRSIHDEIIKELSILFGDPIDIEHSNNVSATIGNFHEEKIIDIVQLVEPRLNRYLKGLIHVSILSLVIIMLTIIYKQKTTISLLKSELNYCKAKD